MHSRWQMNADGGPEVNDTLEDKVRIALCAAPNRETQQPPESKQGGQRFKIRRPMGAPYSPQRD